MYTRRRRANFIVQIFLGLLVFCILSSVYVGVLLPRPQTLPGWNPSVTDSGIPPSSFHVQHNDFTRAITKRIQSAFRSYWNTCRTSDYLQPLTSGCLNSSGLQITLIESIETLYLAGLTEELTVAEFVIQNQFSCEASDWISVSELGTKVIGGLLGAFAVTNKFFFLKKACECADLLLHAFQGPIPYPLVDGQRLKPRSYSFMSGTTMAESSGFLLEFASLSKITGDPKYITAVWNYLKCISRGLAEAKTLPAQWSSTSCRVLGNYAGLSDFTASFVANVIRLHIAMPSEHSAKVIDEIAKIFAKGALATIAMDEKGRRLFSSEMRQLVWLLEKLGDERFNTVLAELRQKSASIGKRSLPKRAFFFRDRSVESFDNGFGFDASILIETLVNGESITENGLLYEHLNQTICGSAECALLDQNPTTRDNIQPSAAIGQWLKFLLLENSSIPWDVVMINEAGHSIPI